MTQNKQPLTASLRKEIARLLQEYLADYGCRHVEIRSGFDHDGDPVLYIDVYYDFSEKPIDPEVTLDSLVALRDKLWRKGESRFPHLRHHFDERQKVKGFA
jgi:hypothetical protein